MKRRPITKYNFHKADFDRINAKLKNTNWLELLIELPSETCLDKFYEILNHIIKEHTPTSSSRVNKFPVWFSRALIKISNKKQKAWIKWKKYKNQSHYEQFSYYRTLFKTQSKECYRKYNMESVEDNIKLDIKHFWKYMSNRKAKPKIPSTMQYLNQRSSDPETICNWFSDFFESVFEPSSASFSQWQPPNDFNSSTNDTISDLYFTENEILKELKQLDVLKGPGPDGLPPLFFKISADYICRPLHIIYNKCITEGIFPGPWKSANITPIHKDG